MRYYRLPEERSAVPDKPRTVALGAFDGLHTGHRSVILRACAASEDGTCAVYTFQPGTLSVKPYAPLCSREEQTALPDEMNITEWFAADFRSVRDLSPAAFVEQILRDTLHARQVVCGFNYRFGKDRAGDPALLTRLCAASGIAVTVVPPVTVGDTPVSSSAVRQALDDGDLLTANRLLGRYYGLSLPVSAGRHLASGWGIPTANQRLPEDRYLPRFGVYASVIRTDSGFFTGVTNIGMRPTVGSDAPTAETHIEGFSGDLYGQIITVYPVVFLRQEQRFSSPEALREQMERDREAAQAVFAPTGSVRAVLLDLDETFYSWSEGLDRAVTAFLSRYFPDLPEEEKAARHAEMALAGGYGYRMTPPGWKAYIESFATRWTEQPVAETEPLVRWMWIRFAEGCRLAQDTAPTLKSLRKAGLRLGIVTNGYPVFQNAKIDLTGSRRLVDEVNISKSEGIAKPDPELFRRAALHLGVAPEDCLYVGDHPVNDVTGSRNAGMTPVLIDRDLPPDHPSHEIAVPPSVRRIRSLAELAGDLGTLDLSDKIR